MSKIVDVDEIFNIFYARVESLQSELTAAKAEIERLKGAKLNTGDVSGSWDWELVAHSHQIADTGDYDGCYEITNGKVLIYTKDDDNEALEPVVKALNESGCKFYLDDSAEFEAHILRVENKRLHYMIENGLGW